MNMNANQFVERVVATLMDENRSRIGSDERLLDVAFMVAPIEQSIGGDEFAPLLATLGDEAEMYYREERDNYGEVQRLHIVTGTEGANYYYVLSFTTNERMWGYCECSPSDAEYDAEHRCCGHGCDWVAPSFSVRKVEHVGHAAWEGDESDYWRYEKAVNALLAENNADVDAASKRERAAYLLAEKERIEKQLAELGV
jgi:hypothetical protein